MRAHIYGCTLDANVSLASSCISVQMQLIEAVRLSTDVLVSVCLTNDHLGVPYIIRLQANKCQDGGRKGSM